MKNYKVIISWLLVILWMIIIFSFSSQNGTESGGLSGRIIDIIVMPFLNFIGVKNVSLPLVGFLVRKAAHMFIYFVLAILTVNAVHISNFFRNILLNYPVAFVVSFLYACSDELHQSFSPGRAMAFSDVLIDSSGALIGLLLYFIIYRWLSKKRASDFKAC